MIGWKLVTKISNSRLDGNWKRSGVKDHVRSEAHERCVYCGIFENYIGGKNAFHRDHYKPKSKFPELENSLSNIYYACPVCNIFKSDSWPNDPERNHSVAAFSDPAVVNYGTMFETDRKKGLVKGVYVESLYIQNVLHLNRPQLIMTRREYYLNRRVEELNRKLSELAPFLLATESEDARSLLASYLTTNSQLSGIVKKGESIPRYETEDMQ